jgi:hypothetical protein
LPNGGRQQGEIVRDAQLAGVCRPCALEQVARDLVKMMLHRLGVGAGHDKRGPASAGLRSISPFRSLAEDKIDG